MFVITMKSVKGIKKVLETLERLAGFTMSGFYIFRVDPDKDAVFEASVSRDGLTEIIKNSEKHGYDIVNIRAIISNDDINENYDENEQLNEYPVSFFKIFISFK